METPTKEKTATEAKFLALKLLIYPDIFTLGELARLHELMEIENATN